LVFCASRDNCCYAIEAAKGRIAWKQDLGEPIVTTPIVSGGRVFVLTIGGSLFALNANSGDVLWRFDDIRTDDGDVFSSPVLAAGRIYAASGGKLYCIGDAPL
jgi:eukaryotic-like serine/threonine-protein kinase